MSFNPRAWQKECLDRFVKKIKEYGPGTSFVLEACMGAGKSSMAAWMAKTLFEEYEIDHVLVVVPWASIQGDTDKGMLGSFSEMGLDCRRRFFTYSRRQVRQPYPEGIPVTVTLYHEVCCEQSAECIRMWREDPRGFKFALICDEIHHTNELDSSWGEYIVQLQKLAEYSIFMSGTYFRTDKKPISCIPLDENDCPVKDYSFPYAQGVTERVVRAVTTRDLNARVKLYDPKYKQEYEVYLSQVKPSELSAAVNKALEPNGDCIRQIIQMVHEDLMKTRSKFLDAACLFVCRPGGGGNYTAEGQEAVEDKYVHLIAERIKEVTGETPTVVTHQDRDSVGKIGYFRRGTDPYIVAVNMISEGCDIPRLRKIAFCRYTDSEMLFRQIAGRALRLHFIDGVQQEDETAAQIYIPAFPLLVEFAERLYVEAQEGIEKRRCPVCGQWPCVCPCEICGERPCICPKPPPPPPPPWAGPIVGIDASPVLDGGHIQGDHVPEYYVSSARRITEISIAHRHSNHVQLGYALQQFVNMRQSGDQPQAASDRPGSSNPAAEREKLRKEINRIARRLALEVYGARVAITPAEKSAAYKRAWREEVEIPFRHRFMVILNTWSVDRLRQVADRLKAREAALRHA